MNAKKIKNKDIKNKIFSNPSARIEQSGCEKAAYLGKIGKTWYLVQEFTCQESELFELIFESGDETPDSNPQKWLNDLLNEAFDGADETCHNLLEQVRWGILPQNEADEILGKKVCEENCEPGINPQFTLVFIKNPAAVALGRIKTAKKAASSRLNGLRGGRPAKHKWVICRIGDGAFMSGNIALSDKCNDLEHATMYSSELAAVNFAVKTWDEYCLGEKVYIDEYVYIPASKKAKAIKKIMEEFDGDEENAASSLQNLEETGYVHSQFGV